MNNDNRLSDFKKELALGYQPDGGYYYKYNKDLATSSFCDSFIKRLLNEGHQSIHFFTQSCENLTRYSLHRALYSAEVLNNNDLIFEEVARSAEYGYMGIHLGSSGCSLDIEYKPFIEFKLATELLIAPVLANNWDRVKIVLTDIINSLNAQSCIVANGQPDIKAHPIWFVVKLLSEVLQKPIDKRKPLHPKNFDKYQEVLEKWDTDDTVEIDKMVYLLSDLHYEIYRDDENSITFLATFPHEIIAWMKIREKLGLKNPKNFSHPFMQQNCVQEILGNKEVLPPPITLPFANDLILGLKNEYKDIQLP